MIPLWRKRLPRALASNAPSAAEAARVSAQMDDLLRAMGYVIPRRPAPPPAHRPRERRPQLARLRAEKPFELSMAAVVLAATVFAALLQLAAAGHP